LSNDDTTILTDDEGREIRLTAERREHILEHPEMVDPFERIVETVNKPEMVVATNADDTVHVYHRYYETTPVTSKFLQVAVKMLGDDAFVLTAFFSRRKKRGTILWKA
jgi:hypothetical protein